MFDIGWTELMVVAVVAIVVIGPKDLPAALRTFGKWTGKMKRMARDFQGQFNEALREAELDDVKKQMTDVKKQMADIGRIDPMADLKSDLTKTHGEIQSSLNKPADSELKLLAADTGTDEPAPVAEAEKPAVAEAAPPPAAPEAAKTSVPAPETSVAAAADAKP